MVDFTASLCLEHNLLIYQLLLLEWLVCIFYFFIGCETFLSIITFSYSRHIIVLIVHSLVGIAVILLIYIEFLLLISFMILTTLFLLFLFLVE